jgi:hypothetical protein
MDYEKLTFKVKFVYDDKAFGEAIESRVFLKDMIHSEYVKLRNIACEAVNPHLEEWNEEFNFDKYSIPEDDELKEWGGTKYCNFIRSKQEPILQEINKKYSTGVVELCCDEICDICGVIRATKFNYDHDVRFSCELIPCDK